MGLFGPPDVGKLQARGDVAGLVKALRHKRTSERAAEALATFDREAVLRAGGGEALTRALVEYDGYWYRAFELFDLAVRLQCVPALIAALQKAKDVELRREAASSLRKLTPSVRIDQGAADALALAMNDEDDFLRAHATLALAGSGDGRVSPKAKAAAEAHFENVKRENARYKQEQESRARREAETAAARAHPIFGRQKVLARLLILVDSHPTGGESRFIQELADGLYDGNGRPYSSSMTPATKITLRVASVPAVNESLAAALAIQEWGAEAAAAQIGYQGFSALGRRGMTVEWWTPSRTAWHPAAGDVPRQQAIVRRWSRILDSPPPILRLRRRRPPRGRPRVVRSSQWRDRPCRCARVHEEVSQPS